MTRTLTGSAPHGRRGQPPVADEPGPWPLAIILMIGVAVGAALWRLGDPPSVPRGLPDATAFRTALTASEVSDADLIAVATTVAWLALGYLALTIGLRTLAVAIERATRGARLARVALRLSHLITVPAVRRVVDGGVAGTLLFSSWMPLSSRVAAAAEPTAVFALHALPAAGVAPSAPGQHVVQGEPARFIAYTVARGDDLWDIARRMYGDGTRYVELFEANRERIMPGGERFSDPRLIRVGWVLHVPLPAASVTAAGDALNYRVARGDHLWGIAARLLDDGFRWTDIWEANRERTMADGRQFTDPNRIFPGWSLVVPTDVIEGEPTDAAAATTVTPEPSATPHPEPARGVETQASDGATPQSTASPGHEVEDAADDGVAWDWPSPSRPLAITVAGFAVLGTAALFVHRLAHTGRWPGLHLPQRGAGGTGDAGRVVLITRALTAAIAAEGFPGARVLRADESAREIRYAITCPAGDADRLAAASGELGTRLHSSVAAEVVDASRIELTLRGAGPAAMALGDASPTAAALIVPVGSDAAGAIVYLNLAAVGSVVVGGAAGERRRLLHDWLAALSTMAGADELAFRADTAAAAILGEDTALAHFGGAAPGGDVDDLVEELEDIIQSRAAEPAPRPLVALVDVASSAGLAAAERLLRPGPNAGVYVVALGVDGDEAGHARFGARLTLGADAADGATPDDTASPIDRGSIVLRIAGDDSVSLEPVLVRRDTSRRWLEGASVPGVNASGSRGDTPDGHHPPAGGDAGEDPAPTAEPPVEMFDWRRAIFDDTKSTSPEPDAPTPELGDPVGDREDKPDVPPLPAVIPTAADPLPKPAPAQDAAEPLELEATTPDGNPLVGRSTGGTAAGPSNGSADRDELENLVKDRRTAATARDGVEPAVLPPPPLAGARMATIARDQLPAPTRQEALLFTDDLVAAPSEPEVTVAKAPVLVYCFGRLRVLVDGAEVRSWPYDKGRELLALLVARGGASVSRQEAADALWPDLPWDASVKHMMSNAATALRAALRTAAGRSDVQPVILTAGRYALQHGVVRSDLDVFDVALRRAASLPDDEALHYYERALAAYGGDFLEAEPFAWVETYQAEYRRRYLAGACRAGEIAIALGDVEGAGRFFRAAVERLPTDEEAARGLMRCCAAAGDRNGVRKTYHTLAAALQDALDAPDSGPSAETRALLTELTAEASVG